MPAERGSHQVMLKMILSNIEGMGYEVTINDNHLNKIMNNIQVVSSMLVETGSNDPAYREMLTTTIFSRGTLLHLYSNNGSSSVIDLTNPESLNQLSDYLKTIGHISNEIC